MAFDAHKNFAITSIAVAPSPPTTGTSLTVTAGDGAIFPAVPFNASVMPAGVRPTPATAEVVRVTARSGDVFTLTRAQESSTARAIVVGDVIAATITAKTLQDVEGVLTNVARTDVANVFVTDQQIKGTTNARLLITDPSQPTNARVFSVLNTSQLLYFTHALDNFAGQAPFALILDRLGNAKIGTDIYEKSRTTPLGHWIDVPWGGVTFGGGWVVESADYITLKYCLLGKTVALMFQFNATSTGGTVVGELTMSMPAGLNGLTSYNLMSYSLDGGSTFAIGTVVPVGNALWFRRTSTGTSPQWPANVANLLFMYGTIVFAIS
jgi:hypothetical protein